jgi:hypothetical protein
MNSAVRLVLAATLGLSLSLGATRSAHAALAFYDETIQGDLDFSFPGDPFTGAPNLGALAAGPNVLIGSVPAPSPQTDIANADDDWFLITIPANFTFEVSLTVSNFVAKLPISGPGNDVGSDGIFLSLDEGSFDNGVASVIQTGDGTSNDGPFGPFAVDTQLLGTIFPPQAIRQTSPSSFDFQSVGGGNYSATITLMAAAVPEARAWLAMGLVAVGAGAVAIAPRRNQTNETANGR